MNLTAAFWWAISLYRLSGVMLVGRKIVGPNTVERLSHVIAFFWEFAAILRRGGVLAYLSL